VTSPRIPTSHSLN
jgi:1-acylglycerone phosphate reductase